MIISIIAALDEQGGIGFENQMPWHLPADLRRFKNITMGHHLLLGRKTYQSIGGPLPGRKMIVLSRNPDCKLAGSQVVSSLEEGLEAARKAGENEVFMIGGGEIYRLALPLADKMYLTRVHTSSQADVFFPAFDPGNWSAICQQDFPADEENPFSYTFSYLTRKNKP